MKIPFVICSDDCDDVSQMRISNPLPRSSNDTFCLNIRAVICRLIILFVNRETAMLSRDKLMGLEIEESHETKLNEEESS